jgi:serine/threonine protein kinase/Tfp pilus assembly protein PilF
MSTCPSPERLQLLLNEKLPAREAELVEAHLQNCADCQQALDRLIGQRNLPRATSPLTTTEDRVLRRLERDLLVEVPRRPAVPPTEAVGATSVPDDSPRERLPAPPRDRYTRTLLHARGGIGRVWLARDAELGRDVALKELLPEHADRPALRARFLEEARITGQLEHPGIVPVYELGRRDGDREPFYTMRFVRGRTLSAAVRDYHAKRTVGSAGPLDLRGLLGAFVGVCNALAYAHARGVLHRDLKGSNVVLGAYGEVIVLDWGLAKVVSNEQPAGGGEEAEGPLAGKAAEPTDLRWPPDMAQTVEVAGPNVAPVAPGSGERTEEGLVLGTPGYMAPEQAAGRPDLVDVRTDVYGLGAILYEILTSRPPFVGTDTHDVLRRVRQEPPVPPRRLNRGAPAALEAVCLKALVKVPALRYAEAGELAQEVQRWLADEPVAAYPEPLRARSTRWARRHPALLAGAAALLLAGLLGLGLGLAAVRAEERRTAAERDRAEENSAEAGRQRGRAEAVNRFLVEDLLAEASPDKNPRAKQVTVLEVLDKAAAKVEQGFPNQPELEADVRYAIGETYWHLGRFEQAGPQLARAVALRRERLGPDHPETLDAENLLGVTLQDRGELAEAEPLLRRSLEIRRRVLGPEHAETLGAENNLGELLREEGRLAEAEALFRHGLEIRRRTLGPENPRTLITENNLGLLLHDRGALAEAEPLLRHNLDAERRVHSSDHPGALSAVNNLARLLWEQGRPAEAEPLFRQNLEAARRVFGPDHTNTLGAVNNLAHVLQAQKKWGEAEPLLRQNADALRRVLGPDHPNTLTAVNHLAGLLCDQGKPREAETLAADALARCRKALPPDHPVLAHSLAVLGSVRTDSGRAVEAEPLLRECLEHRRKYLPPGHRHTAEAESLLGRCLAAQTRYAEAEPLLRKAYEALKATKGASAEAVHQARERLVKLYEAWGKTGEASRWRDMP